MRALLILFRAAEMEKKERAVKCERLLCWKQSDLEDSSSRHHLPHSFKQDRRKNTQSPGIKLLIGELDFLSRESYVLVGTREYTKKNTKSLPQQTWHRYRPPCFCCLVGRELATERERTKGCQRHSECLCEVLCETRDRRERFLFPVTHGRNALNDATRKQKIGNKQRFPCLHFFYGVPVKSSLLVSKFLFPLPGLGH